MQSFGLSDMAAEEKNIIKKKPRTLYKGKKRIDFL